MRITYRTSSVKEYWTERWSDIPADVAMTNVDVYPLKYSLQTVLANDGPILEAGCGVGRILRYFHDRQYDISGIDFIKIAIDKLRTVDQSLKVKVDDICNLEYPDNSFRYILAFGLFHNLETGLDEAVLESWRVLISQGRICVSFRADNFQTRLTDLLASFKSRKSKSSGNHKVFHKLNLSRKELTRLFERNGFFIESVSPVENMPILYKFPFFRSCTHKHFDENKARAEGYRLSKLGQFLQGLLMSYFPDQFCNIYVLIAIKP